MDKKKNNSEKKGATAGSEQPAKKKKQGAKTAQAERSEATAAFAGKQPKAKQTKPEEQKETRKMKKQEAIAEERADRLQEAQRRVKKRALISLSPALVPIPIVDIVALTGIQLDLARSLAKLYEIPFRKDIGKSVIISLLGGLLPVSLAPLAASAMKIIPLIGQFAGGLSLGVFCSGSTYAIGKVFIQHFESGGTFLDLNPEAVREHYADMFQEGKKAASE